MGYFGMLEEKTRAQNLRKQGLSYREILQEIPVSKDTISRWCKDVVLTSSQKLRLIQNKKFGQKKGSLIAAENKRQARIKRTNQIQKEAKKELGKLQDRDIFTIGIALYAAEGNKTDGKGGFANSDPRLIKFMMGWFVKCAKISPDRIRGALWLHDGLDEAKAKEFWSNLTGIPLNQFHKTYIAKVKNDSKKIRKNIHQFGVFSIRFTDAEKQRRITGWISALFNSKISELNNIPA